MNNPNRYADHLRAYSEYATAFSSGEDCFEKMENVFATALAFQAEGYDAMFAYTPIVIALRINQFKLQPSRTRYFERIGDHFQGAVLGTDLCAQCVAYSGKFDELSRLVDRPDFNSLMMLEKLTYDGGAV